MCCPRAAATSAIAVACGTPIPSTPRVVQAALHIAVNFALIPTTGVTLPFMSYGRSSLLICLAAVGVLLNIARAAQGRTE